MAAGPPPRAPRRAVLRTAAALGAGAALPAAVRAADGTLPAAVRDALRAGGAVVLVRHAQTEPGVGDPPGFRLDDCATQRNLSAAGRVQAQRLGRLLAQAGVPLAEVRSSRWCRCVDTARLAFGRVEPWPPLDSFFADRGRERAQTEALRGWVLEPGGPGLRVGVTHQVNLTALTGEWTAMGEALVLRAEGGAPRVLARLPVPV